MGYKAMVRSLGHRLKELEAEEAGVRRAMTALLKTPTTKVRTRTPKRRPGRKPGRKARVPRKALAKRKDGKYHVPRQRKVCANPDCTRGPGGTRRRFNGIKRKLYCSPECRKAVDNKAYAERHPEYWKKHPERDQSKPGADPVKRAAALAANRVRWSKARDKGTVLLPGDPLHAGPGSGSGSGSGVVRA